MRIEFDPLEPPNPDLFRVSGTTRRLLFKYAGEESYDLPENEMAKVIFDFSKNIYEKVVQPGSSTKLYFGETPISLKRGEEPWHIDEHDTQVQMHFEAKGEDRDALRLISVWSGVNSTARQLDNFFRLFNFAHELIKAKRSIQLRTGNRIEEIVLPAPWAIEEAERILRNQRI